MTDDNCETVSIAASFPGSTAQLFFSHVVKYLLCAKKAGQKSLGTRLWSIGPHVYILIAQIGVVYARKVLFVHRDCKTVVVHTQR